MTCNEDVILTRADIAGDVKSSQRPESAKDLLRSAESAVSARETEAGEPPEAPATVPVTPNEEMDA